MLVDELAPALSDYAIARDADPQFAHAARSR
jgi:hypothetical protein